MSILELLGFRPAAAVATNARDTETVRRIVDRLDHLEPDRARFVASFAYILSRVAHADMDISQDETRAMERIVVERGHLPEELAVVVVQMAKTQNVLFGGTENFLVTREMNRSATHEQKLSIVDCLFAVSAADDSISSAEDTVIRQIATELGLEHRDFIAVRAAYRDRLAVLKKPDDASSDS